MHVYLAAACPQCRSTTMMVTNQGDVRGRDHAIDCGVCGRRVIAVGLTGKGLRWHGSMDPGIWANMLREFASEGVDSFTIAESGRGRGESRVVSPQPLWSTTPRETPRCVASRIV